MSRATEFVDDIPRHLTVRASAVSNTMVKPSELGDREYWCLRCDRRVTQTLDESAEYGHHPGCEHSIRKRDDHALEWRGPMEDS